MNGIHDMGGLHGFGRVEIEPDEPVFHARWEARVFGLVQSLPGNIDAGRHSIELLDPISYLKDGYYGRWLAALERSLVAFGVIAPAELEKQTRSRKRAEPATFPQRSPRYEPSAGHGYSRPVTAPPAFAVGQAVVTQNHQPAGHTRLPGYARCRRGTIVRLHGAMVFPDDHAHGRGENPQHLYTVRFAARELWGEDAEPDTVVHLDLFESYLSAAG